MLNLTSVISSILNVQQTNARASQRATSTSASTTTSATAPPQSSTASAGAAAQASGQAANTSASTASTASANASQGSAPAVSASSTTSVSAAGVVPVSVKTSVAAGPSRASSAAQASANAADLDRHFAIGMQKSAGAYASDHLSDMLATRPDASSVAASLETSQKRFQSLVSQIADSAPPPAANDQGGPADSASSASTARVQNAYADAAA